MFSSTILGAAALAFIAGTNAHVVMNTPTPYGFKTLQTSPLNGEGFNFPCQSGSRTNAFDAEGASNPLVVGQDNPLKFTGSAVHGGGSCQLSVTYDDPPPADKSKWKVIHSYLGGCPALTDGNLEVAPKPDADGRPTGSPCSSPDQKDCLRTLTYQIPEGMKNGNATLAWTWFNNVGNREMYMNCAPISISGGSEDDTYFNSLPEMFVANIPGECTTNDRGGVIGFPNPGDMVTTSSQQITPGAQGNCPAVGSGSGSSSGSGSGSGSAPSSSAPPSSYAAPSSSAAASTPVLSALSSAYSSATETSAAAPSISLYSQPAKGIAHVTVTTMATVTGYPPVASASAAAPFAAASEVSNANGSSSTGSCQAGKVSCPTPGDIMCIGDSQFGLCNIDNCAFPENLSAGTQCVGNVISGKQRAKRTIRAHRHAHQRSS